MKTVTAQDIAERIAQATGLSSDIGLQILNAAVDFMRDELVAGLAWMLQRACQECELLAPASSCFASPHQRVKRV